VRALLWGREVGVSIYSGAPKLVVFYFSAQKPAEPVFKKLLANTADWQKKVNSTKIG
jgi:hypothetical protein